LCPPATLKKVTLESIRELPTGLTMVSSCAKQTRVGPGIGQYWREKKIFVV
jgi:hypothetical protein